MANRHTIILVQPAGKPSRTFLDFETVPAAMDAVCQLFEKRLKELNPSMRSITYDVNDLYHYIDTLPDLSALVYAPGAQPYLAASVARWRGAHTGVLRVGSRRCVQLGCTARHARKQGAITRRSGSVGAIARASRFLPLPDLTPAGAPRRAELNAYQPFNKDWIKRSCFQQLKKQASG